MMTPAPAAERPAFLNVDGYAGRRRIPVMVVGETPKRLRVRVLSACSIPRNRRVDAGAVVLVPKTAITPFPEPGWKHATNAVDFRFGGVFGWTENGALWSGIVEECDHIHLRVKVRDVRPGVMRHG